MEVQLSADLEAFVNDQVSSGNFASTDALVQAGIRIMQNDPLSLVKAELWEGIRQADAGEFSSRTIEDIKRDARRKFEAQQAQQED